VQVCSQKSNAISGYGQRYGLFILIFDACDIPIQVTAVSTSNCDTLVALGVNIIEQCTLQTYFIIHNKGHFVEFPISKHCRGLTDKNRAELFYGVSHKTFDLALTLIGVFQVNQIYLENSDITSCFCLSYFFIQNERKLLSYLSEK